MVISEFQQHAVEGFLSTGTLHCADRTGALDEAEPIVEAVHNTERSFVLGLAKGSDPMPSSTFWHPQTVPPFLTLKNPENRCLEPLLYDQGRNSTHSNPRRPHLFRSGMGEKMRGPRQKVRPLRIEKMATPGPRPKPTTLKVFAGNPGRQPLNDQELKPEVQAPPCPSHLGKEWRRISALLVSLDVVSDLDMTASATFLPKSKTNLSNSCLPWKMISPIRSRSWHLPRIS